MHMTYGIYFDRSSDYGTSYHKVALPLDATVTHMYSSKVDRRKVIHAFRVIHI